MSRKFVSAHIPRPCPSRIRDEQAEQGRELVDVSLMIATGRKGLPPLTIKTTSAKKSNTAPIWHPKESLDEHLTVIPRKERVLRKIPTLNRKLFNTAEKNGVWISAKWPFLVYKLIEVGMRKRNLSFRQEHKQNIENTLRWVAYNSDAVTGCINVTRLCIEIGKEIGVSSSTISIIMKELVVMDILYEPVHSGQSIQDIMHDGRLPRTLCATPLYYELLGIHNDELEFFRASEIKRREIKAAKDNKQYSADIALKGYCQSNILRVWEYRHAKSNSSYTIKISNMKPLERLSYMSRKLIERIRKKGWNVSTEEDNIIRISHIQLDRMGLSVNQSRSNTSNQNAIEPPQRDTKV